MNEKILVAGVGMIPFTKPGKSKSYDEMAEDAVRLALADANIDFSEIGQAYAGYVFGESCSGQAGLYRVGLTGVPIINVNNNCSTGSSALFLARQAIKAGAVDVALAVGFEMMLPGAPAGAWTDRKAPSFQLEQNVKAIQGWQENAPPAAQFFGGAGIEYQKKYGMKNETFAQVSVKARRHAKANPMAVFRDPITLEDVLNSPTLYGPITRLQCCPPTCGAAAAIVVSADYAKKKGLKRTVTIAGQGIATDTQSFAEAKSMMSMVGYDMTRLASERAYKMAGIGPDDVDVVELHDCFTANEIISQEALGLVPEGGSEKFILDGQNTYGGRLVVNPSGGLLAKGHPLGATGLAQITELVTQLRGEGGERQVSGAKVGLQHNVGLGGACVVTLLSV
ncbi:MAG: lipid-transfer protein [Azonexus sp.]|jgi:acetyl-CoA acetyltransferase|nr:lipid-transfer protein [Azonexus sp.]